MANSMGHQWNYGSTEDIWEEIRQVAPVFSGITHDRLKDSAGIFWPCFDDEHSGTPRLYEDGFIFRDRRARFIPAPTPEILMEPTPDYPYVLITGRFLEHFNTGEMTRRSKKLMRVRNESYIEINAADAEKADLSEDDIIRVTSPCGTVKLKLKVSKAIPTGYLFAPIHFSKPNLNALMSAVPLDPQARMPALKVVPVDIEPKAH